MEGGAAAPGPLSPFSWLATSELQQSLANPVFSVVSHSMYCNHSMIAVAEKKNGAPTS